MFQPLHDTGVFGDKQNVTVMVVSKGEIEDQARMARGETPQMRRKRILPDTVTQYQPGSSQSSSSSSQGREINRKVLLDVKKHLEEAYLDDPKTADPLSFSQGSDGSFSLSQTSIQESVADAYALSRYFIETLEISKIRQLSLPEVAFTDADISNDRDFFVELYNAINKNAWVLKRLVDAALDILPASPKPEPSQDLRRSKRVRFGQDC